MAVSEAGRSPEIACPCRLQRFHHLRGGSTPITKPSTEDAEQGAAPATAAGVSDSFVFWFFIDFQCRPRSLSRQWGELGSFCALVLASISSIARSQWSLSSCRWLRSPATYSLRISSCASSRNSLASFTTGAEPVASANGGQGFSFVRFVLISVVFCAVAALCVGRKCLSVFSQPRQVWLIPFVSVSGLIESRICIETCLVQKVASPDRANPYGFRSVHNACAVV